MRKNALINSCYVCAAGAFGTFFRWLQNQSAFDAESGLVQSSALNILVPLVIIAAAVLFYFLVKKIKSKNYDVPTDIFSVFCGTSILYPVSYYAIAFVTCLGGIITMFAVSEDSFSTVYRVIALLAVLCGLGFPVICSSRRKRYAPPIICAFMTVPIVMFCVWLIACYKVNSSNPTIWAFAIEVITICICILAFYYNAGFAFGKPSPYKALYISMLGAFMCITTLADTRYFGMQLIYLGAAGMLVTESWLIISNMRKLPETAESKKSEVKKQPEKPAAEPEKVIEPGAKEDSPEPTIQAPERKSKAATDDVAELLDECKKYLD